MGDEEQHVVGLTVPADRAEDLGREIAGWLVDRRIIEINQGRNEPYNPGAYHPGEHWRDALAEPPPTSEDPVGRVDVHTGRQVFGMGEFAGAWGCPACGFRVETEMVEAIIGESEKEYSFLEAWEAGDEPRRTCERCGHASLVGDWRDVSSAVAHLGLTFTNWPPLSDGFVATMGARLGPRTILVHAHI